MGQKRLFLAILISDSLKKSLADFPPRIREDLERRETPYRFIPPENFHLTMKFFGSTQLEAEISDVTRRVAHDTPPFVLEVRSIGAFPRAESARVIWAGVRKTKELVELKQDLEKQYEFLGFQKVEEFIPHITLARFSTTQNIRSVVEPFRDKHFGRLLVEEIVLFESIPRSSIPEYKIIKRFSLARIA